MMSYDPRHVLAALDVHIVPVMLFMSMCLGATFVFLVAAFRTGRRHRAYPAPLVSMGWFAVHDAYYVLQWHKWFVQYDHWWLKTWAITLIFTSAIEFVLCYQVYRYGREELMPKLSQRQFALAMAGAMVAIAVVWAMVKPLLNDDLSLIAFALTAWWPPVCSTLLLVRRQSMRGQTMLMNWCLLINPIGMNGAWMFLDPYFRSPIYLCFAAVTIIWAAFNLFIMSKYPRYVPEAEPEPSGLQVALA
jgi:hypothetical protein